MRIYRIKSNKTLFAFGDSIANVPVLSTTLANYQEKVCKEVGLTLIDVEETLADSLTTVGYFEFDESLLFTAGFLSAAIAQIKTHLRTSIFSFL